MSTTMLAQGSEHNIEQTDERSSRRVSSFPGNIEVELESVSTSSESTDDDSSSTDPGRVATDFDAATTMDWMNLMSPPFGGAPRSLASVPQNYMRSPLGRMRTNSVPRSSSPRSQKSVVRPPIQLADKPVRGISPFNEYIPPSAADLQRLSKSLTPKPSAEIARFPPVDQERVQKTIESIAESINWTRALTEHDDNFKSEHDAALAILYVLTVKLNQGVPNKHLPLYRSLQKTVKSLAKWCQDVITHRAGWEWPMVSVTLRGYIQKLKDIRAALEIDSDPNTLAERLNAKIEAHNANRTEAEAIRQARKQKELEDKAARKQARAEIRALHQQFVLMKRAQAEGVEVTDYLEDDASSRRQIQDSESEGGSRPRLPVGSIHTSQSGAIGPPPPRSSITASDRPSMSSLGNILHHEHSIASPLQPRSPSRERLTTSALRAPPVTANTSSTHQEKAHSLASVPSSKPLPHRPISMSNLSGSVPRSPPRSNASSESTNPQSRGSGDTEPRRDGGESVAPTSPERLNRPQSPIPPIHVTPSTSARYSVSAKSEPRVEKQISQKSSDATPSAPPEYDSPRPAPPDSHYNVAHSPKRTSSSSNMNELEAMLNRVSNKPGPSIAPTVARTTNAGDDLDTYRDLSYFGSLPHSQRPDRAKSRPQARPAEPGPGNASVKSPFTEASPLSEDAELATQQPTYPPINEQGWMKSSHRDGFGTRAQSPGVHIRLYESEYPPGINEVLDTAEGPFFPHIAETVMRSQVDPSHMGDNPNRPTKYPSPPEIYEPSVDTARGSPKKGRNSGSISRISSKQMGKIPSIA